MATRPWYDFGGKVDDMSTLGRIRRWMNSFGQPDAVPDAVTSYREVTPDDMGDPNQPFGMAEGPISGGAPPQAPGFSQQDFTQVVPIAGAQNVGVQRPGNPLQTLLSSIQRRRQGQQGLLQSGFTGRV